MREGIEGEAVEVSKGREGGAEEVRGEGGRGSRGERG